MSSQRVNLNDEVSDIFSFSVGGFDFDFHYPTMDELEPVVKNNDEREKLEKAGGDNSARLAEIEEESAKIIYGFIHPVGHDNPIREVMKKQTIGVNKKFNEMLINLLKAE